MNVAALTRDGSVSTAAACEAHVTRPMATVPVTAREAVAWANENDIAFPPGRDILDVVNAARQALGLPLFEIATAQHQRPLVSPKPCTLPPIAENEAEMMALVRNYVGTKTGTLTPAMAAVLLKLNVGNRVLTRAQVQRYGSIIKESRWVLSGEPLIVSAAGVLNDGAHRLNAIVETGIPIEIDIRFGADRTAFKVTNTGAMRTAGQALYILGHRNTSQKAAIARMLFLYDSGRIAAGGGSKVEPAQIIDVIKANPDIERAADFVRGGGAGFSGTRTTPFGFTLVLAGRATSFDKALEFGRAVKDGRGGDTDPTRVLHLKLRDLRGRFTQFELAAPAVRAWNAWVSGKSLARIQMLGADNTIAGFPRACGPQRGEQ